MALEEDTRHKDYRRFSHFSCTHDELNFTRTNAFRRGRLRAAPPYGDMLLWQACAYVVQHPATVRPVLSLLKKAAQSVKASVEPLIFFWNAVGFALA